MRYRDTIFMKTVFQWLSSVRFQPLRSLCCGRPAHHVRLSTGTSAKCGPTPPQCHTACDHFGSKEFGITCHHGTLPSTRLDMA